MSERVSQVVGRAKNISAGFTTGQKAVVSVALVALIMGAIALTNWIAQPSLTPLYGNMSGSDASAVVEELKTQGVQYQLSNGGTTVLVPQSQVDDLRISLMAKGIPANAENSSWQLLDSQGMTSTDFQQNVAYERALESELAKTIGAIQGVKTAVVNLAIPKRDVFSEESDDPTAAVLVDLTAGTDLNKTQIRSITNLVAGSVPGLKPEKVTVSDSEGTMLTAPEGSGAASSAAEDADQQTAAYEDRVSTSLQQMLDRVLGKGKAVVRVNAQLDYSERETTRELYLNSPTPQPMTESTSKENYNGAGSGIGGQMGVTSPTLSPYAGSNGNGLYNKENRTVNNGVSKELTKEQATPGGVQRLSVAVALDAETAGAVDTAAVQSLVAGAAGVDAARGDVVQVNKLPFDKAGVEAAKTELAQAESAAKRAEYIDIGKKAALVLLVAVVGIVLMLRSRRRGTQIEATASDLPEGLLMPARMDELVAARRRELSAGPEDGDQKVLAQQDARRDQLASFMDSQPDDIAALVQGWLSDRSS